MFGREEEVYGVQHEMKRSHAALQVVRVEMLWLHPENTSSFIVARIEFIVL